MQYRGLLFGKYKGNRSEKVEAESELTKRSLIIRGNWLKTIIFCLVLLAVLMVKNDTMYAEDQIAGDWKYVLETNPTDYHEYAKLIEYLGPEIPELILPETVDGYKVERIGEYAIYSDEVSRFGVTKVIVCNNMRIIDDYAFGRLEGLKEIWLNEGLVSLGNCAFYMTAIESLTIPASVMTIPFYSGEDDVSNSGPLIMATELKEVKVLSDKYFFIEDGVLYQRWKEGKSRLVGYPMKLEKKTFVVPEHVIEIVEYLFYYNRIIEEVVLNNEILYIPSHMFDNASNLKRVVLGTNITTIKEKGFSNCLNLRNINFNSKLRNIDHYAFFLTNSIDEYIFPNGLEYLGSYLFYKSNLIKSISIPETVNRIGENLFYNINCNLIDVYGIKFPINDNFSGFHNTRIIRSHNRGTVYQYCKEHDLLDRFEAFYLEIKKYPIRIKKGASKQLIAENNANCNVIWSSSNNKVLSVTKEGKIKALGYGTAIITAKAKIGDVTYVDSKAITVPQISVKESSLSLEDGKTKKISITKNTTGNNLLYLSSNKRIAMVTSQGIVKGIRPGNVTITIRSKDKLYEKKIKAKVRGVYYPKSRLTFSKGSKHQLKSIVNTTGKKLYYKTSNSKIASVSKSGKVTSYFPGTCMISLYTKQGGYIDKVKVKVVGIAFKVHTLRIKRGRRIALPLVNTTNKSIDYKVKNSKIVKVNKTGIVTALRKGTTEITIKSQKKYEDKIKIIVR